MTKKILSLLLCAVTLFTMAISLGTVAFAADTAEETADVIVKNAVYDAEEKKITVTLANKGEAISDMYFIIGEYDETKIVFDPSTQVQNSYGYTLIAASTGPVVEGGTKVVEISAIIADPDNLPEVSAVIEYQTNASVAVAGESLQSKQIEIANIFEKDEEVSKGQVILNFVDQMGITKIVKGFMTNWKQVVMILISLILLYLAIGKGFEPLLLIPIAFGMLLTNLPGAEMFHEALFAEGHVHWELFTATENFTPGLLDYLYLGVKLGIYPCLIFFGVGAMTDFAPLIANPKSLLLGAAAQVGIFLAYIGASLLGFTSPEAASIGIIGGADGPTAIFVTSQLAPWLLGPIAVAAYSYMALVPVIQPPIMKLLTTKEERRIKMVPLRQVSKVEKIIFPIIVTIVVALLVPSATPLVGSLMLGNLFKECGVAERLSKTVQNELMNIVTIFLGITVGATATANTFLTPKTLGIMLMGVCAFACGTAGGLLLAKFMNLFLPKDKKINPLIGSAGVSAVPMAARVSQMVGQKENPSNFLLMHAMGPNVAGVIGSAIAAGVLIALFG